MLITVLSSLLIGCSNGSVNTNAKADSVTKATMVTYPFTAKSSLNRQPGDEKNAARVLNCLKKYVNDDIKGACAYFADTAEFIADKFYYKRKSGFHLLYR